MKKRGKKNKIGLMLNEENESYHTIEKQNYYFEHYRDDIK